MSILKKEITTILEDIFFQLFRYAKEVSIYDEVLVHTDDRMVPETVTNISNIYLEGNYQSLPSDKEVKESLNYGDWLLLKMKYFTSLTLYLLLYLHHTIRVVIRRIVCGKKEDFDITCTIFK